MKIHFILLTLLAIIFPSYSLWNCSDPNCTAVFSTCTDNYCQCNSDRVFNCTHTATSLNQGSYSFTVHQNQPQYFILNVPIDKQVEYNVKLSDSSHTNLLSAYNLGFNIDQGTGEQLSYPSGYYSLSDNTIELQLEFELDYISGTSISQRLVINATYKQSGSSTLTIQFSESSFNWTSLMMILAYIAGGLLLIATIAMLIVMCKRNREDERSRQQRSIIQQRKTNDISHFNALMPIATLGTQKLKQAGSCSVCLGQFQSNSIVRTTVCGHVFHSNCIDQWCVKNISCPICRTQLTQQNVMVIRNNTDPSNDNSSWVVNTIDYSDSDSSHEDNETVQRRITGGQSRRQMRRPLNRPSINNQNL